MIQQIQNCSHEGTNNGEQVGGMSLSNDIYSITFAMIEIYGCVLFIANTTSFFL